jgi:hypothetical protein
MNVQVQSTVQHASTSGLATTTRSRFSKMLPEENNTGINKEKYTRLDWQTLRTQSLQPGGFGEERVTIWYAIISLNNIN